MFVKIIYKGRESVFECERYSLWEMEANRAMLEIRGPYNADIEIQKDLKIEIYILNSQGKTIDTYRWG